MAYGKKTHRPFECPNFTLSWKSIIPNRVGLAGSSALLTAALRTLITHAHYEIPLLDQVDIIWKTEKENLGIPSGPQDRVAQVFEGLIFLRQTKEGELQVEELDYKTLPPLFVAINEIPNEGQNNHSNLRSDTWKETRLSRKGYAAQRPSHRSRGYQCHGELSWSSD